MKYMFAIECSKPGATNAAIGAMIAGSCPPSCGRRTSATRPGRRGVAEKAEHDCLAEAKAGLASGDRSAVDADLPRPRTCTASRTQKAAVAIAPAKFPAKTTPQFRNGGALLTLRLAQAMTMRLFR